ncbi:MAG TPA: beta-propeller fold lactonase family protein, partial [Solirubrobacterales bacterium]|nr:beta-propeller fold lactonase family protein [Solirubrobacterales bacterium]
MADVTAPQRSLLALAALVALAALLPASAFAAKPAPGTLTQLQGKQGCIVDRSSKPGTCAVGRGLRGAGPFMGSEAVAVSPDGRNVYVAAFDSDAIATFSRNPKSGALTQPKGTAGCISAKGRAGCAKVAAFDGPNSVAVSPDGRNVYAGAFFGSAVVAFSRDPSSGALTQLAGTAGCIAAATVGCATGIALGSIEGLAVSPDGASVYAAAAASNALTELSRDPSTGALTQLAAPNSCISNAPLTGCVEGRELGGANAVAVAPGGESAYVTSFLSNSVTAFDRTVGTGVLAQKEATNACLVFLRSAGCSFGRAMLAPEGLDVSPDGRNVYVASIGTGAIDVLAR